MEIRNAKNGIPHFYDSTLDNPEDNGDSITVFINPDAIQGDLLSREHSLDLITLIAKIQSLNNISNNLDREVRVITEEQSQFSKFEDLIESSTIFLFLLFETISEKQKEIIEVIYNRIRESEKKTMYLWFKEKYLNKVSDFILHFPDKHDKNYIHRYTAISEVVIPIILKILSPQESRNIMVADIDGIYAGDVKIADLESLGFFSSDKKLIALRRELRELKNKAQQQESAGKKDIADKIAVKESEIDDHVKTLFNNIVLPLAQLENTESGHGFKERVVNLLKEGSYDECVKDFNCDTVNASFTKFVEKTDKGYYDYLSLYRTVIGILKMTNRENRYEEIKRTYEYAQNIVKKGNIGFEFIFEHAFFEEEYGEIDKAVELLEYILNRSIADSYLIDEKLLIRTKIELGAILLRKNPLEAEKHLLDSINCLEAHKEYDGDSQFILACAYTEYAKLLLNQRRNREVLELIKKAISITAAIALDNNPLHGAAWARANALYASYLWSSDFNSYNKAKTVFDNTIDFLERISLYDWEFHRILIEIYSDQAERYLEDNDNSYGKNKIVIENCKRLLEKHIRERRLFRTEEIRLMRIESELLFSEFNLLEAKKICEGIIQICSDEDCIDWIKTQILLGRIFHRLYNSKESIKHFEEAKRSINRLREKDDRQFEVVYSDLCLFIANLKRDCDEDNAEEYYRYAIAALPNDVRSSIKRAIILREKGAFLAKRDNQKAIDSIKKSIEILDRIKEGLKEPICSVDLNLVRAYNCLAAVSTKEKEDKVWYSKSVSYFMNIYTSPISISKIFKYEYVMALIGLAEAFSWLGCNDDTIEYSKKALTIYNSFTDIELPLTEAGIKYRIELNLLRPLIRENEYAIEKYSEFLKRNFYEEAKESANSVDITWKNDILFEKEMSKYRLTYDEIESRFYQE